MSAVPDIRPVTDAEELQDLYAGLLAPSFPPAELVPADWLIDGVASGRVSVLTAEDETGPVAIAVTEHLHPSPVLLLTYFATRADVRGQGVGSTLFRAVLEEVVARERPPLVLAEVERPDRHTGSAEFGDPAARLRFYGRHGARVLDLPYFQPPIGDGEPVHGMVLLALHVDPGGTCPEGPGVRGPGLLAGAIDAVLGEPAPDGDGPAAARLREAARTECVRLHAVADYALVEPSVPD